MRIVHYRGMTIMELLASMALLAAAMVALVQFTVLVGRYRQALEHRRLALQELANQAERLALTAWDETAADKLKTWQVSQELAEALPRATCQASVSEEPGQPVSRRIHLQIVWTNSAGQQVEPVSLAIWKFKLEGEP